MGVPNAVKAAADKARLAHAARLKGQTISPQTVVPATIVSNDANLAGQPPANSSQPTLEEIAASALLPTTTAPAVVTVDPLQDWETRYKNMRAAGDKRATEATARLKVAEDRVRELETELSTLRGGSAGQSNLNISEEESDFLGAEGVAVLERMQKSHKADMDALRGQITPATTDTPTTTDTRTGGTFYQQLDSLSDDWRETNRDKYFHAWLAQINPQTGYPRQEDLDIAQEAQDAKSVVGIVNAFRTDNPIASSNQVAELQGQRAGANTFVGGSSDIPAGYHAEYTGKDVKDFYHRKTQIMNRHRNGRASQGELDAIAIEEADIRKAHTEGRVSG